MLLTFVLGFMAGGFAGLCVGLFLAASLDASKCIKLPPPTVNAAAPAPPAPGGSSHDLVLDLKKELEKKQEQDKTMFDK